MSLQKHGIWRLLLGNVWTVVCLVATASCITLSVQLLLRLPPLGSEVLVERIALSVPALFGSLAGLYGLVMSVLSAARNARLVQAQRKLAHFQERARELESIRIRHRNRIEGLSALREVATVINQESDFAIIAEKTLELICGLLEPLEATLLLEEGKDGKMRPIVQYAGGKLLTGRKPLTRSIPDFSLTEFESQSIVCRVHGQELHALVPLKVDESVLGVLFLVFATDDRPAQVQIAEFNRMRRQLLLELAHHISLAVKTKHLHTKAVMDALTGLYSRSHFNVQLLVNIEFTERSAEAFSLILIDVDHFKKVNDTYGHATGDVVLARLAKRIMGTLRKYDTAYRYGGEEIAILLPRTRMRQATLIAERLRMQVEAHKFRSADGKLVHVTVSLGVAQFQPTDTADKVFDLADRRLYRAKRQGRNRVVPAAA